MQHLQIELTHVAVGRGGISSMTQQHLDNIHVTPNTGKHQRSMLLQWQCTIVATVENMAFV